MEDNVFSQSKLDSKYLYQIIFSYIKIKDFKLDLFKYSKKYQKKLDIRKIDYINAYLSNQSINFEPYFTFKKKFNTIEDKDIINKRLDNYLKELNIDFDSIKEYAINSYENEDNNNQIKVDIYSPFFDSLLKKDFNKNFEIKIPMDKIDKFNLKNDYISTIEKLNNSGLDKNYPCIYFKYKNPNDINFLKDLKLNSNLLKRLKLKRINDEEIKKEEMEIETDSKDTKSFSNFYKALFLLPDIQNNLIDLELKINKKNKNLIISDSFQEINNLKALQNLYINGYNFENTFVLRLFNLQKLKLDEVKNFEFDESNAFYLKDLIILSSEKSKSNSKINFPELKTLKFANESYKNSFLSIFDFKNIKFLKELIIDNDSFININDDDLSSLNALEEVIILSNGQNGAEAIKKLLLIKNLKTTNVFLDIDDEILKDIQGENLSLETFVIQEGRIVCELTKVQKLFPNIKKIIIHSNKTMYDTSGYWCLTCIMEHRGKSIPSIIEIKENKDCKTDKIHLLGEGCKYIGFNLTSYENVKEIIIDITNQIKVITLPLLSETDKKFNSLTNFTFFNKCNPGNYNIDISILKSIYTNIDNMPKLKIFKLKCYTRKVDKEFYNDFIRKLLSLKLDQIVLLVKFGVSGLKRYSRKELKEIYPDMNHLDFSNISIYNLGDGNDTFRRNFGFSRF